MKLNSYRQVNVLVTIETYRQLKDLSYELKLPMSVIMRSGIKHVLKNKKIDQNLQVKA